MSRGSTPRWLAVALAAATVGGCGSDSDKAVSGAASRPSPTATTATVEDAGTTTQTRSKRPHFDTVDDAVAYIANRVDVPVAVPANLPTGATVASAAAEDGSGYLTLRLPGSRGLTIQYGKAGFDGCGPDHPRQVMVGDNPAVIEVTKLHTSDKFNGHTYTTLVWPATLKELDGRYALSGIFSEKQILAFAQSMDKARATKPRGPAVVLRVGTRPGDLHLLVGSVPRFARLVDGLAELGGLLFHAVCVGHRLVVRFLQVLLSLLGFHVRLRGPGAHRLPGCGWGGTGGSQSAAIA
jgi:hypothetical protein